MLGIMEQEKLSEEAPPATMIVGHLQTSSDTAVPLTENPLQSSAEATGSGQATHESRELTATPPPPFVVGDQVQRLKIASIAFGVSLFLNWGAGYWVEGLFYGEFFGPYYFGWDSINGLGEMIGWLNFMIVEAWLIDEYRFWFEERGPLPVLLVLLRDLMPFVFIGALGLAWSKKDQDADLLGKIGVFTCGYAGLMATVMLYITINFGADYGGLEVMIEIFFESLGFWVAVFAGVFFHPRLVPLPERFKAKDKGRSVYSDLALNEPTESVKIQTAEDALELWVMIVYYLPLLYLLMVVISVSGGGDDDALFWGTVIPIIGFLIGLLNYGMEFLKGFLTNLGFCIPVSLALGLAGFIGVFGDVDSLGEILLFVILPALYLPYRRHTQKEHRWALGAAYAAPLGTMGIVFGLMLGVVMRYGLF